MFDIGFSELMLIAVAAIIVIGPKDLPVVVRHVAKLMRELRQFYLGAKRQAMQLADEAGLNDLKQEVTTIIDLEGKPQQAYDVRELEALRAVAGKRSAITTSPTGEATRLSERSELSRSGEGMVTPESPSLTLPSPNPLPKGESASIAVLPADES